MIAATAPPIAERVVRSADGLGLFVRDYAPFTLSGAVDLGVPVLCLHGLTRNARDFERVAERLAALGRRAIAMDVRGRGRSDWDAQPQRYQPMTYAQDAVRVLDALGIERAVWIGTSMGGLITAAAAAIAPDRIAAAVLNDIGPVIETAGLRRIAGYAGKTAPQASWAEAAAAVKASNAVAFPDADDAFWMTMARRMFRARADGRLEADYDPAIAAAVDPAAPAPDLRPLFAALAPVPVLMVRGALSDILSAEGVAAMRALKPDLQVAEAPGVGHAPTLEEEATWLPIVDFLARAP